MLLHHATDGAGHAVHGLAEILAAVRRDEDEAGALRPLELELGIALAHGGADDPVLGLGHALAEQVQLARLRGDEIALADDVDGLTVELLRPGAVGVVHTKAGHGVSHGDLRTEAGERGDEAGRGVSADKHNIGASLPRGRT